MSERVGWGEALSRVGARTGLDKLLARYPDAEVAYVASQSEEIVCARAADLLPFEQCPHISPGPWVLVDLWENRQGGLLRFAIWRRTGAVYRVGEGGAVEDDPFIGGDDG